MAITGSTDFGNGLLCLTVDADPTTTAVDAPAGSLLFYSGTLYQKQDTGVTTNSRPLVVADASGLVPLAQLPGTAGTKDNLTATVNPAVTDDSASGYGVGSVWVNTVTKIAYTCTDASVGAAAWPSGTPSGPAGGDLAGTYPNPTTKQASNDFSLPGDISPTSLAASANDYNPTGLSAASTIRLTSSTNVNVTGIQGGADGRILLLHNANASGGSNITLTTDDSSSTAAHRFVFVANITLEPSASCLVQYDATSSRWRAFGIPGPSGAGGPPSGPAGGDLAGTYPNPAVAQASQAFAFTGVITPAAITSDQNDYSPAGISTAATLRISSDATRTVTGIAGGTQGRLLILINVGLNPIVLEDESLSSSAANRFEISSNVTLVSGSVISLIYDSTSLRWRSQGGTGGAASGGLIQTKWVEVVGNQTTGVTTWPSASTTIAVGSNGAALPQGTINVAATAAFSTSGSLTIETTAGTQEVAYTGKTLTTFTGCTGGSGTMSTGGLVRAIVRTTIAAGSDGAALPQGTINVASTSNFPASGSLNVFTSTGFNTVTYTGVTATSFTGCAGGTGTLSTGNPITSITAQDLLSINLSTTAGASLIVIFLACASNAINNAQAFFRVVIDGRVIRGSSIKANGGSAASGTDVSFKVSGVSSGPHSVVVQWRVNSGTGQLRPVTAEDENASLLVQEVSS